jgi:hypothetical protein
MKLNKITYYVLSFTWGLTISLIGFIIFLILLISDKKPHIYNSQNIYIALGKNWGGFSLGIFTFCQTNYTDHILYHELGHSIQNCLFGIFMPFIVSIPSAIRYWYRHFKKKYNPNIILPPYESIWFEHQATEWGYKNKGRG